MCARQRNDLLVVKTHAVKDVPQVLGTLSGVRQTAIRCAMRAVGLVGSARRKADFRSSHFFDGNNAGQDPQVRIRDAREFLLDRFQSCAGVVQTSIGTVSCLRVETHGCTVRTSRPVFFVESSRCVPSQANQDRTERPIIPFRLIQEVSNCFANSAVVDVVGTRESSLGHSEGGQSKDSGTCDSDFAAGLGESSTGRRGKRPSSRFFEGV
mmetsp:Transcript_13418/g.19181  ORF Transcript_13418/g.19181 Transcript_13418/m.19181 type:complete len:210 (+) Transcript_13418:541-1170(+)